MNANQDADRFRKAFSQLCVSLGQEITEPLLASYWMALADLKIEVVERAIWRAVREEKIGFPRPARIRELAGAGESDNDRAVSAWAKVLKAIPLGPYRTVTFDDRVINAAIRNLGGWPSMVERFGSTEEEGWARKDFIKTYQSLANSAITNELGSPLPGLSQVEVRNGQMVDPVPLLVSDKPTRPLLGYNSQKTDAPHARIAVAMKKA